VKVLLWFGAIHGPIPGSGLVQSLNVAAAAAILLQALAGQGSST
jgi:tRNA G18 (ribose-2'-O)-methylase SpoU